MKFEKLIGFLGRLYEKKDENTIPIREKKVSIWVGLALFVAATAAILCLLFSCSSKQPQVKKDLGTACAAYADLPDRDLVLQDAGNILFI